MENEFIALVNQNRGMMYHARNTYAASINEEDDLIQDMLFGAWKNFNTFKKSSKFSTWFYAICRNICIDRVRKKKSEPVIVPITNDIAEGIAYKSDLYEKIKQGIRYETVINNLPADEQQIVFMYLDGLSFKEIEAQTGIDGNTLRTRISRIKKRLMLRYGK
jgi:RNA polymerase sigma factor (sigma-70 family)